ncbi:MAG TPA: hypothetical protein VHO29_15185 [Marmoricola sp.]|nr:hypothetical protein [Marmoricola sp.]
MPTVDQIASHHGVSSEFVRRALAKLGVHAETGTTNVHPQHVKRFAETYGERIRSARPEQATEPGSMEEPATEPAPTEELPSRRISPHQHVIRSGYEHISSRRNMETMDRIEILSPNPGPAHAIDPEGTWDGDPWRERPFRPRGAWLEDHLFYSHPGPRAACGVRLRVIFRSPFTAETADPCPKCVALVEGGRAYRNPPGSYIPTTCGEYIRVKIDDAVKVETCVRRWGHKGRHESWSRASWEPGGTDFQPAPEG